MGMTHLFKGLDKKTFFCFLGTLTMLVSVSSTIFVAHADAQELPNVESVVTAVSHPNYEYFRLDFLDKTTADPTPTPTVAPTVAPQPTTEPEPTVEPTAAPDDPSKMEASFSSIEVGDTLRHTVASLDQVHKDSAKASLIGSFSYLAGVNVDVSLKKTNTLKIFFNVSGVKGSTATIYAENATQPGRWESLGTIVLDRNATGENPIVFSVPLYDNAIYDKNRLGWEMVVDTFIAGKGAIITPAPEVSGKPGPSTGCDTVGFNSFFVCFFLIFLSTFLLSGTETFCKKEN